MDIESLFKNINLKKWLLGGALTLIAFMIIREVIATIFFHSIFNDVSSTIKQQSKAIQDFHQEAKQEMKRIENGMDDQQHAIHDGINTMHSDINKFNKEFSKGVNDFYIGWNEDAKKWKQFDKDADAIVDKSIKKADAEMEKRKQKFFVNSDKKIAKHLAVEKTDKIQQGKLFDDAKKSVKEGYRY